MNSTTLQPAVIRHCPPRSSAASASYSFQSNQRAQPSSLYLESGSNAYDGLGLSQVSITGQIVIEMTERHHGRRIPPAMHFFITAQ